MIRPPDPPLPALRETVAAPTLQLLAWVAERPRGYAETIDVWKTACPRLAVWEDALADGLIRVRNGQVLLTPAGKELVSPDRRTLGS